MPAAANADTAAPARTTGQECAHQPEQRRDRGEMRRKAEIDRDYRAERGAQRDPEQSGLSQRIAGHTLQNSPRQPENRTDLERQNGARQAQLRDNSRSKIAILRPQAVPHRADGQPHATRQKRYEEHRAQQQ
jgi:hypothetical protein